MPCESTLSLSTTKTTHTDTKLHTYTHIYKQLHTHTHTTTYYDVLSHLSLYMYTLAEPGHQHTRWTQTNRQALKHKLYVNVGNQYKINTQTHTHASSNNDLVGKSRHIICSLSLSLPLVFCCWSVEWISQSKQSPLPILGRLTWLIISTSRGQNYVM